MEELAVDRHTQSHRSAALVSFDKRFVEGIARIYAPAGQLLYCHRDPHAGLDLNVIAKSPIDGLEHAVGFDLGQVAELTEVHAENRHVMERRELDSAKHRTITPERNDKRGSLGELMWFADRSFEIELVDVLVEQRKLVPTFSQPCRQAASVILRVVTNLVDD